MRRGQLIRAAASALVAVGVLAGGCSPPAPPPSAPQPPSTGSAKLQERPGRAIAASAAPPSASAGDSETVARLGSTTFTKDQLLAPMVKAHGLSFLLHIVQLEMARQAAAQQGITATPEDFKKELDITLKGMFKDSDEALRVKLKEAKDKGDNDAIDKITAELNVDKTSLLDQYLVQTRSSLTRVEFEIGMQTNAYLRKIAEASPDLKKALTDDMLRNAFAAQYGEKVVVRHIQCQQLPKIQEAQRRLRAGENFADVAKTISENTSTGPLGGSVLPFTMNATGVPEIFRKTAFSLKVGEVSDPVVADNAYHLIKVENRIAPTVVKFENVKETLRADLYDKLVQAGVLQLRDKLSAQIVHNIQIDNPELKAQFAKRLEEGKLRQQQQIDAAMKRDRAAPVPEAAPDTEPAPAPQTKPASAKPPAAKKPAAPAK